MLACAALLATVLALAGGAAATPARDALPTVEVSLQLVDPPGRPGPGGALVPAGETVTFKITVSPANLLVGSGGKHVVEVRGAKGFDMRSKNFEDRVWNRLKNNPDYTSRKTCARTPCRLQIQGHSEAIWDFRAVLLRGKTRVDWSNRVRVHWHSPPTALILEGNGFTCTKRFPNTGVSGNRLFCTGTTPLPGSVEEVAPYQNGASVELTAKVRPGVPEGWWLKLSEQGGHLICEVPRKHAATKNSCTGFAAEKTLPDFRRDRYWPVDIQLLEYEGLNGPPVGIYGSLHEVGIWWGCPQSGRIPQCP
jgi:hypothetical protein